MKVLCALVFCFLLSACGQTGPLYMPGKATGVHKKDEFVLGNNQDKQKETPAAKSGDKNTTKPPAAETTTNSDTSVTKSADDSTTPDENSEPLGEEDTAPPGTVQ